MSIGCVSSGAAAYTPQRTESILQSLQVQPTNQDSDGDDDSSSTSDVNSVKSAPPPPVDANRGRTLDVSA
ncbi:MAG: hypothetical protein IPK66_04000 [Rhodospirillales bacterium]|nr:hypothetical protein [Rhodospirillales bacterium]